MPSPSTPTHPPPGRLIPVAGKTMHLHCTGSGSPTVILEAGGASWSLDWHLVQEKVAAFTRVCSYDRAGFGWSDPRPGPRHAQAMVDELSSLLSASGEVGPYIIVGASFGGHIARLFAAQHRREASGVVLLDARHEDLDNRMPPSWTRIERSGAAAQRAMLLLSKIGLLRLVGRLGGERSLPPAARKLPPEMREAYLTVGYQPKYFETNLAELAAIAQSDSQVKGAPGLGDIPLIVIRHGRPDIFATMPPPDAKRAETVWQELQAELAALSSDSRLIVAEGSGHAIQLDQPELPVSAIHDLVVRIRQDGLRRAGA